MSEYTMQSDASIAHLGDCVGYLTNLEFIYPTVLWYKLDMLVFGVLTE